MKLRHSCCLLALAFLLTFGAALPAASAAEPETDAPEAWETGTVALQSLGGAATSLAMTIGGIYLIIESGAWTTHTGSTDRRYVAAGAGLLVGIPVGVPVVTNLIANNRGYPSQHLGGHLGGLAGGAVGLATGAGIAHVAPTWGRVSGPLYLLGTVVGSIVGYHTQANRRQADRSPETGLSRGTPVVGPAVDPDGDDPGWSLGWRARF